MDFIDQVRQLSPSSGLQMDSRTVILVLSLTVLVLFLIVLWRVAADKARHIAADYKQFKETVESERRHFDDVLKEKNDKIALLESYRDKYQHIPDAEQHRIELEKKAAEIERQAALNAQEVFKKNEQNCIQLVTHLRQVMDGLIDRSTNQTQVALTKSDEIINAARTSAERIAGDALRAFAERDTIKGVIEALERQRVGYSDQYIVPPNALLDELSITYAFTDAAKKLKEAKSQSAKLRKEGKAFSCNNTNEKVRISLASIILDAFDDRSYGIIDSAKSTNAGVLEKQLTDFYDTINASAKHLNGSNIEKAYYNARLKELKWACALMEIRKNHQEEQRELREKMREEERARKELEKAQRDAAKEQETYQKLLAQAMEKAQNSTAAHKAEFDAKVLELQAKLKEAEEKNQRTQSMAQQTKSGNVYIISNIGSFGEDIIKIGMTRRLEPLDRIRELGDASVPFDFDVHALIYCDDAPALESELHNRFIETKVNKVNQRKEFFRVSLNAVKQYLDKRGVSAKWTLAAAAEQYRETLRIEQMINESPEERKRWEAAMASRAALNGSSEDDLAEAS